MKTLMKTLFVLGILLISQHASATIEGSIDASPDYSDVKILTDFQEAVAVAGGKVDQNSKTAISVAGEFPTLRTIVFATIKSTEKGKVLSIVVQAKAQVIELLIGFTASKEKDVFEKITTELVRRGYASPTAN